MEIEIAILEQYRGKGLSSIILDDLCKQLFTRENPCHSVFLSIDKRNHSSIRMATKNGFYLNEERTKELRKYGDLNTLVFSKDNYLLEENYDSVKKAVS